MLGALDGHGLQTFLYYWCQHVYYAPYILFGLLLLSGFNIPVGEEPLLVFGGVLTARCAPQEALWIWSWLYLGSILAAYETYWIGRLAGPYVQSFPLFRRLVDPDLIEKMGRRIERYGFWTFLVGRFCPGSVRNALFFTSGWTELPFRTFMIRDGIAAIISTATFFILGMELSEHADALFRDIELVRHWMGLLVLIVLFSLFASWGWNRWVRK